jgi:hypothetical protein
LPGSRAKKEMANEHFFAYFQPIFSVQLYEKLHSENSNAATSCPHLGVDRLTSGFPSEVSGK